LQQAQSLQYEALRHARALGDRWLTKITIDGLCVTVMTSDETERANSRLRELLAESLALGEEIGTLRGAVETLAIAAAVADRLCAATMARRLEAMSLRHAGATMRRIDAPGLLARRATASSGGQPPAMSATRDGLVASVQEARAWLARA
jgi:hypothetical protein